jgi:hypothetical protein
VNDESAEQRAARLEKAIAQGLELLAAGRAAEAQRELSQALAAPAQTPHAPAIGEEVSDLELERAFASAEPETEQMLDADRVAQVAMRQADAALGDELGPEEVGTVFATATMADLLERQGDRAGAERIRAGLAPARDAGAARSGGRRRRGRQQVVATLERWLENLRGGARP